MRRSTPAVISLDVVGPCALKLAFDDGVVREVDLTGQLWGPIMQPLKDPEYFAKVSIDPETRSIFWPNGADFSPEFLHGDFDPER